MTCKEFEKLIPDYVAKKMDYLTLKEFYAHMQACPECKEELTINFLVTDGLQKLEEGDAYDLNEEWSGRVDETKRRLRLNESIIRFSFWVEVVMIGIIIGVAAWLLLP